MEVRGGGVCAGTGRGGMDTCWRTAAPFVAFLFNELGLSL